MDELIEQYRTDQKGLHEREVESVKTRFQQKIEIGKERMAQMNTQLIEESGDIDEQVRLFSQSLLNNKIEDEKVDLEQEQRRKLQELRQQKQDEIDKAKQRLADETKAKLERDRERERVRAAGGNHELEDAKEEAQRESE